MIKLRLEQESPFTITGETTKKNVKKGETVVFKLQVDGDPTVPDMDATINLTVTDADPSDGFPPPDPKTDYEKPRIELDGVPIGYYHVFTFPSGGHFNIDIFFTILETAKYFNSLDILVDVVGVVRS